MPVIMFLSIATFIWAGRAAADFSLGDAKVIYYMGGVDGWALQS